MRFALLMALSLFAASNSSLAAWDAPFVEAVNRLKLGMQDEHSATSANFIKNANDLWTALKKNEKDWQHLLNPAKKIQDLMAPRQVFARKDYIAKVFPTKAGTLIFNMRKFPRIIVKIDNRADSSFGLGYKSYLSAMENSQKVQKEATPGAFSLLFLPYETGRDSKEAGVKVVFSEKAPLFSSEEIDHMVLLQTMLNTQNKDPKLKEKLQQMFAQAIAYICRVNFNDINYKNIPFSSDGRLTPFDTDTGLAQTGVHTFAKYFFVPLVLSKEKVEELVATHCSGKNDRLLTNLNSLYAQEAAMRALFATNNDALQKMTKFLQTRQAAPASIASTLKNVQEQKHAGVIDALIAKKLSDKEGKTLFGQRCEHAQDLINAASFPLEALGLDAALAKAEQILQAGVDAGIIHSFAPIKSVKDFSDLRGFICF